MESLEAIARVAEPPVSEKLLSAAVVAAQDSSVVRRFFREDAEGFEKAALLLTDTLNAQGGGSKVKTAALVILANFAKPKTTRDVLYNCLKRIDTMFEETLKEKETAAKDFGTTLGKLHATTLVLMMRVFGYKLSGADVLEYASEKISFALDIVLDVLKVPTYEAEIVANCCCVLSDLSSPLREAAADPAQMRAFNAKIELFMDSVMQHNIVSIMSAAIKRHVAKQVVPGGSDDSSAKLRLLTHATHTAVVLLSKAVYNLYLFSPEETTAVAMRQSLLVSTDLISSTYPKYIHAVCDELYRCVDCTTGVVIFPFPPGLAYGITQALRCMCLATFHLGSHNHKMRYVNAFTLRLLGLPIRDFILQHMDLYAHLLHYQVNIDALAGEHGLKESAGGGKFVENTQPVPEACTSAVIIRLLSQLLATFSKKESEDLWKEIATSCHLLPLARDTVSYELLSNLFELSIGRGTPDGAAPAAQLVSSPDGAVVVAGAPAGAQATPAAAAAASAAAAAQPLTPQLEDLDSRMQALELSSPPDPALTTAAPPLPSSAAEGSTDAVAPTPAPAVPAAAAVPAAPAAALDLRLLGSLPALPTGGGLSQNSSPTVNGGQVFEPITSAPLDDVGGATPVKPAMPKHTAEAWANATVSADVPTEFLCGINGHLLRHPVRSPTGEVFEQETIQAWLRKVGSTNPITGAALQESELVKDEALNRKILEWHILQNVSANDAGDEAMDMYSF